MTETPMTTTKTKTRLRLRYRCGQCPQRFRTKLEMYQHCYGIPWENVPPTHPAQEKRPQPDTTEE